MLPEDPRFARLDNLDGRAFELALVDLFQILGYEEVTHIGGFDKGADIVFVRDGKKVAVQAKRRKDAVHLDAVRQLIDGMRRYKCSAGLVVTNAFFTKPAIECAKEWGIELWDRRVLADFLDGTAPEVDTSVCAHCGAKVTRGVTGYCLNNPARFGGVVYCMKHQKRSERHAD
jgi:restriction system protein